MPLTPAAALSRLLDNRVGEARIRYARTLSNFLNVKSALSTQKTALPWDVTVGGEGVTEEAVTADSGDTSTGDAITPSLSIGTHRISHQFPISRIAIAEAAALAPGRLSDLYGHQLDDALSVIFRQVNKRLFDGDGTPATGNIVGLGKVIDNTFAYGGVTNSAWAALVNTNATPRAFSRAIMLAMDEQISIAQEDYDMVVMHPTQATKYVALFDTIAGNLSVPDKVDGAGNGLKRADLGHNGRYYNGRPIIEDPQCPIDRIYLMDSSQLDLFIFDAATGTSNPNDPADQVVNTSYGLPILITALPSNNPDMRKFNFRLHPQWRIFSRKSLKGILQLT